MNDSLSQSDSGEEGEWVEEAESEEEHGMAVVSLIDDAVFPSVSEMIAHCKEKGLDFLGIRDRLSLDFYSTVKLINFIRNHVREGIPLPDPVELEHLEGDHLLKPVLDDDALILYLDDLPEPESRATAELDSLPRQKEELQAELDSLKRQFVNYRLAVQQTLDQRWGTDDSLPESSQAVENKDDSEDYFEGYAQNEIHETMLKDRVRTDAYRDFIYQNKHLFAGKVVLDVGCGTGILSMFCARAGAKQVFAVDGSDVLDRARENVIRNGLEKVVVCVKGKIEDVVLPVSRVDVVVSEWMGYCLLYEAMLPSVIWARDRYLAPDGLMVPSQASMWLAPVRDADYVADRVDFWRDVYGFDMSAMRSLRDVRVEAMASGSACGTAHAFRFLDLYSVRVEDLVFDVPWKSTLTREVERLDGFLIWFDIFFSPTRHDATVLSTMTAREWAAGDAVGARTSFTTGPDGPETHWKQGLLVVEQSRGENMADGSVVEGHISYTMPEDKGKARGVNLEVGWAVVGGKDKRSQKWLLH